MSSEMCFLQHANSWHYPSHFHDKTSQQRGSCGSRKHRSASQGNDRARRRVSECRAGDKCNARCGCEAQNAKCNVHPSATPAHPAEGSSCADILASRDCVRSGGITKLDVILHDRSGCLRTSHTFFLRSWLSNFTTGIDMHKFPLTMKVFPSTRLGYTAQPRWYKFFIPTSLWKWF